MSNIAFVPARSGSKRLPHKNVRPLLGKPLAVHTLEAFVSLDEIDQVIFSTDSIEYWDIVRESVRSEKLILDHRDPDNAGDEVKIFDYLKSNASKIFSNVNDNFILGLPTSPLRQGHHILDALNLYFELRRPIFSASTYNFHLSFAFYLDATHGWLPVLDENPMVTGQTRSQDQRVFYRPNGAICIRKVKDLFNPCLQTIYSGALPYIMSKESSVDVDDEHDFDFVESLLKKRLENKEH